MTARTRILIGAGFGILAVVRYFRKPRVEEDRPAMIVRGGSLIFQSGDERAGEKGKPWRQVGQERWTPYQPQGRPAMYMVLTVEPEDGCDVKRQPVTDLHIRYFGTAGLEAFQITTANGHGPVRIPLVVGPALREGNGSPDFPTIERPGPGDVFSLSYRTTRGETRGCEVTRAKIEFFD